MSTMAKILRPFRLKIRNISTINKIAILALNWTTGTNRDLIVQHAKRSCWQHDRIHGGNTADAYWSTIATSGESATVFFVDCMVAKKSLSFYNLNIWCHTVSKHFWATSLPKVHWIRNSTNVTEFCFQSALTSILTTQNSNNNKITNSPFLN